MGKQNKRKSGEGVVAAAGAETQTPNKNASPKKVKIHAESPKQPKNKPMKTPIKHKDPKSPSAAKPSPKKKPANAATKATKPGQSAIKILPEDLVSKLTRRQKKRVAGKVVKNLKLKGIEDLSKIDPNDASVKEIVETLVEKTNAPKTQSPAGKNKAKVMKKVAGAEETPKKKGPKTPKTPKKSPTA